MGMPIKTEGIPRGLLVGYEFWDLGKYKCYKLTKHHWKGQLHLFQLSFANSKHQARNFNPVSAHVCHLEEGLKQKVKIESLVFKIYKTK